MRCSPASTAISTRRHSDCTTISAGAGPTRIEARTWRQRGHWAGDVAAYRHGSAPIGARDPLEIQAERLLSRRQASTETLAQIREEADAQVVEAVARAKALPEAGLAELGLNEVFV
jgi:pyruvate dehydrogenase E1 component alpha subunit